MYYESIIFEIAFLKLMPNMVHVDTSDDTKLNFILYDSAIILFNLAFIFGNIWLTFRGGINVLAGDFLKMFN